MRVIFDLETCAAQPVRQGWKRKRLDMPVMPPFVPPLPPPLPLFLSPFFVPCFVTLLGLTDFSNKVAARGVPMANHEHRRGPVLIRNYFFNHPGRCKALGPRHRCSKWYLLERVESNDGFSSLCRYAQGVCQSQGNGGCIVGRTSGNICNLCQMYHSQQTMSHSRGKGCTHVWKRSQIWVWQ